jgi:hypothetical protein
MVPAQVAGDSGARADQVMEAGPATVRADRSPAELAERLGSRELRTAVVAGLGAG